MTDIGREKAIRDNYSSGWIFRKFKNALKVKIGIGKRALCDQRLCIVNITWRSIRRTMICRVVFR